MSSFFNLITTYRKSAKSEREKVLILIWFDLICIKYFENETVYAALFTKVQSYPEWAKEQGLTGKDTGIDLVAAMQTADSMRCNASCCGQI